MKMTRLKQWFAAAVVAGAGVWSANAAMTHTAVTLDTRAMILAEVLPESCTYAATPGDYTVLTVTFNEDVSGGQFELPDNLGPIAFDLNGQTLTGAAGTVGTAASAGGDGAWVFKVGSGTQITVLDSATTVGAIVGGAGGNGTPVGKGAFAFVDASGAQFAVTDAQGLVSKGADGKLMVVGAEGNPWSVGGDVVAYTNGAGGLVVSGAGAAGDFSKTNPAPWAAFADKIKSVTIADGVESIGSRFFKGCTHLGTVTGGKDLVAVGENAFYQCMSLEAISLENAAVLDSLANAIVYHTAIDAEGKPYVIPFIDIPGYKNVLYGAVDLAEPDWKEIPTGTRMEESGYHFFKFVLKKIGE